MAEAIPFSITEKILTSLASLALQEIGLAWNIKIDLQKLESTLTTIKAVLLDADEQQSKSHAVRLWLAKLNDVVYDADDVMDDFATEVLRKKVKKAQQSMSKKVRSFIPSSSKSVAFHFKMGHRIKEIRERLDEIALNMSQFNFRERVVDTRIETREREQTHSFVHTSKVIGREEEKEKIIQLLLSSGEDQENLSIIPIVGIGGLGKTTFAQLVYNDERVQNHFEQRMWVCVSEDFNVSKLTEKILRCATDNECVNLNMEQLQTRLRKIIDERRYLLALDDVWNENQEKWATMKDLLVGGAKGSKIIVTTRSEKVASIMGTVVPFHLTGLHKDDCRRLFKQRAFKEGEEWEYPKLVEIGNEIARKCGGVPLAAKTLGSLMRFKRKEIEWLYVQNNEIWKIAHEENGILPSLKLSYDHLSPSLKQCFAYCSLFPKDSEIQKGMLIQLWIAQGFIQSSEGNQQLEDIGEEYFEELLWRSFFQDAKEDRHGNIKTCKMHDLVHDLAQFVAGFEHSIVNADRGDISSFDSKKILENARHLSVVPCSSNLRTLEPFLKAKNLRTILMPSHRLFFDGYRLNINKLSGFRCLRVLDLHNFRIKKLPSSISELKHLRYLDLSRNEYMATLPESITNLQNLQTLNLFRCSRLFQFPKDIGSMISLRHIGIDDFVPLPCGLGKLSSLQTLSFFVLEKNTGSRLRELHNLNHLRGDLRITNLQNITNPSDAKEANLKEKKNIQSLYLGWEPDEEGNNISREFTVLEGLKPPSYLNSLSIEGYGGVGFPHWMMMMGQLLLNLVEINLCRCKRSELLPSLGQLPYLKCLSLSEMDAIKNINGHKIFFGDGRNMVRGGGRVGFPSLKELRLSEMPNLEEWSRVLVDDDKTKSTTTTSEQQLSLLSFPCLVKLTISRCPNLTTIPFHPSLENLVLSECNKKLLNSMMMMMTPFENSRTLLLSPSSILSNLKTLGIFKCEDIVSLPEEGFQNLTSLERLKINDCLSLSCLPDELENLKSLQQLEIGNCPNVSFLPKGIQHLTGLQRLSIRGCVHLSRWCAGEDWHKIAHVPSVEINGHEL